MQSLAQKLSKFRFATTYMIVNFISIYFVLNHEIWRDEAQAWIIARDSSNLTELSANSAYEGRPLLWYLLLFLITRLTTEIIFFKLFLILINLLNYWIIFFKIKGPNYIKILLASGFYFTFGFTILARDYSIILLLLLYAYFLIENLTKKNTAFLHITILTLASINLFALIMAFSLSFGLFLKMKISSYEKISRRTGFIFIGEISWFVWMLASSRLPPNAYFSVNPPYEYLEISVGATKSIFFKSVGFFAQVFFPYETSYSVTRWTIPFALTSLVFIYVILSQFPIFVRVASLVGITLYAIFNIVSYSPFWWHRGTIAIALILLTIWAINYGNQQKSRIKIVLIIILLIQTSGSIFGLGKTFYDQRPYSNSENVASFLEEICDKECTLVAENDMSASAITAFMPGRKIFYINRSAFGTFASWKIDEFGKYSNGWNDLADDVKSFEENIFILPTDSKVLIPENYHKKVFVGSVWGDDYILAWK
jgi:hypothetical protein